MGGGCKCKHEDHENKESPLEATGKPASAAKPESQVVGANRYYRCVLYLSLFVYWI